MMKFLFKLDLFDGQQEKLNIHRVSLVKISQFFWYIFLFVFALFHCFFVFTVTEKIYRKGLLRIVWKALQSFQSNPGSILLGYREWQISGHDQ